MPGAAIGCGGQLLAFRRFDERDGEGEAEPPVERHDDARLCTPKDCLQREIEQAWVGPWPTSGSPRTAPVAVTSGSSATPLRVRTSQTP